MNTRVGACLFAITMIASEALAQPPPQKFVPATVKPSELAVRLELAGRIPTKTNPTSPVAVGGDLLLVDEAGYIYRWNADGTQELFTPKNAPAGVSLAGPEPLLNVAANAAGSKVYLVLVSSRVPRGVPQHRSVRDPDAWYIVYEYDFGPGGLTQAKPLVAMQTRTDGHLGGGLAVLDDGSVLFSAGDNGDSYEDGRAYSQALDSHLAKIVRINTADGSLRIVAYGVRGAQRLVVSGSGNESRLTFVDNGGWVAEELNSIPVRDLVAAGGPLNFGWGRNKEDGKAREGTLYLDPLGNSIGKIPAGEPGFVEPVADFGRESTTAFAASGPVISQRSFSTITALVSDLVSGALFATTGALSDTRQDVFRVRLIDAQQRPTTLKELAGGERPDPRLFNFPDGSAGVLIERTGQFYRLTEVATTK